MSVIRSAFGQKLAPRFWLQPQSEFCRALTWPKATVTALAALPSTKPIWPGGSMKKKQECITGITIVNREMCDGIGRKQKQTFRHATSLP
jgi:hypothetical protein